MLILPATYYVHAKGYKVFFKISRILVVFILSFLAEWILDVAPIFILKLCQVNTSTNNIDNNYIHGYFFSEILLMVR